MTSTNWKDIMRDYTEAQTPMPDAENLLLMVKNAKAMTSSSGKEMVVADLLVAEGPHKGREITKFLVLSDNQRSLQILLSDFLALGVDEAFLNEEPTMAQIAEKIIGAHVRAKVGRDEYQGVPKNVANYFKPAEQSLSDVSNVRPVAAAGSNPFDS